MASAFDTRYAFVAALGEQGAERAFRPVTLWLTRDFGLSVEWAEASLQADLVTPSTLDCLPALRRLRPDDGGLAAVEKGTCVTVPLLDAQGCLIGQLGLGDPGPSWRFLAKERLAPLARLAAAELMNLRSGAQARQAQPAP
jgi:hypothetical protein